jgi:hypothetical protein
MTVQSPYWLPIWLNISLFRCRCFPHFSMLTGDHFFLHPPVTHFPPRTSEITWKLSSLSQCHFHRLLRAFCTFLQPFSQVWNRIASLHIAQTSPFCTHMPNMANTWSYRSALQCNWGGASNWKLLKHMCKGFHHTCQMPQFSHSHTSCSGDIIHRTFWSSLGNALIIHNYYLR